MDPREFPTKGNLMLAKNSLMLARQGYDLMDKKRNILLKELMGLIDEAKDIQEEIDATFTKAYACLQRANIEHGISKVQELAFTVPIEDSLKMQIRSIMGTEIPHIKYDAKQNDLTYSFSTTHESVDIAREAFREVKELTIKLADIEIEAENNIRFLDQFLGEIRIFLMYHDILSARHPSIKRGKCVRYYYRYIILTVSG